MVSSIIGNDVPGNRLRVRVPCLPLFWSPVRFTIAIGLGTFLASKIVLAHGCSWHRLLACVGVFTGWKPVPRLPFATQRIFVPASGLFFFVDGLNNLPRDVSLFGVDHDTNVFADAAHKEIAFGDVRQSDLDLQAGIF